MRIVELLRPHAPRTAPAFDGIMGMALRRLRGANAVSQQSSQSKRLGLLNLEDPAAYIQFF